MTGIFPLIEKNSSSGFNNYSEITLESRRFLGCFGFLEEEVESLITKFNLNIHKNDIKDWYTFYNTGEVSLYNPCSILKLLKEKEIKNYWKNSKSLQFLSPLLRKDCFQHYLASLIQGDSIKCSIEYLSCQRLQKMKKAIDSNDEVEANILLTYLYHTGYLTKGKDTDTLKIPNKEIATIFSDIKNVGTSQ